MAKTSSIEKNKRRMRLVAKYATKRAELKAIIKDLSNSYDQRMEAQAKLQKLPLNSSPTRVRNRCVLTGRPRAYMGLFGLCRIKFRELALQGFLPGVKKASW